MKKFFANLHKQCQQTRQYTCFGQATGETLEELKADAERVATENKVYGMVYLSEVNFNQMHSIYNGNAGRFYAHNPHFYSM